MYIAKMFALGSSFATKNNYSACSKNLPYNFVAAASS